MTITKIQTTHNPADVLTKHLPSSTISLHLERLCLRTDSTQSVGYLRGLPSSQRMTIGMIGLLQPTDNEAQPVVAGTASTLASNRAMRQPQAEEKTNFVHSTASQCTASTRTSR
eukprot:2647299-Amphidinium_carterae.1